MELRHATDESMILKIHQVWEDPMQRSILTALSAGIILVVFAALPPMLPGSTTMSLSGSALAEKKTPTTDAVNLNSSRSNVYRKDSKTGTQTQGATKKVSCPGGQIAVGDSSGCVKPTPPPLPIHR